MNHPLKEGYRLASKQIFSLATLFIFHLMWGTLFFRFVQHQVQAVMERFPPREFSGERVNLFIHESILLLQETDLARSVIWTLLLFTALRLLVIPMLHAGVYNSLHDPKGPRGTVFLQGLRKFGGSFTWLYWLRLGLTAIPLYWAIPAAISTLSDLGTWISLSFKLAPWLLGILLYGSLLKILFLYIQISLVAEERITGMLFFVIRHLWPVCKLAIIVFATGLLLSSLAYSASFQWAGFTALIVYLAWPLVQIWLKIWAIAVQYRYWSTAI